jgi:hypothetical protein
MVRSNTSGYFPAPFINRANSGKVRAGIKFRDGTINPGVKPNMCVAPPPGKQRLPKTSPRF